MTRRLWWWFGGLIGIDVLLWALTLHAQADFHSPAGGQSTSLGIVIGAIASIAVLVAAVLVQLGGRQAASYRQDTARGSARPASVNPNKSNNGRH